MTIKLLLAEFSKIVTSGRSYKFLLGGLVKIVTSWFGYKVLLRRRGFPQLLQVGVSMNSYYKARPKIVPRGVIIVIEKF